MPESNKTRLSLQEAEALFKKLEKRCKVKLEVAGSVRRRQPQVGDLDVLVWGKASEITKVCEKGDRVVEVGEKKATIIFQGVQVNAFQTKADVHGAMLMFATGPGGWNIGMRVRARKKCNRKLSQYGVFPASVPNGYDTWNDPAKLRVAGATEEEMFGALDKPYKKPELRGR